MPVLRASATPRLRSWRTISTRASANGGRSGGAVAEPSSTTIASTDTSTCMSAARSARSATSCQRSRLGITTETSGDGRRTAGGSELWLGAAPDAVVEPERSRAAQAQHEVERARRDAARGDVLGGEARGRLVERADRALARAARACRVVHDRARLVVDLPAAGRHAPAQVGVLPVHPVALVESGERLERAAADEHARARHPVDAAAGPEAVPELGRRHPAGPQQEARERGTPAVEARPEARAGPPVGPRPS